MCVVKNTDNDYNVCVSVLFNALTCDKRDDELINSQHRNYKTSITFIVTDLNSTKCVSVSYSLDVCVRIREVKDTHDYTLLNMCNVTVVLSVCECTRVSERTVRQWMIGECRTNILYYMLKVQRRGPLLLQLLLYMNICIISWATSLPYIHTHISLYFDIFLNILLKGLRQLSSYNITLPRL